MKSTVTIFFLSFISLSFTLAQQNLVPNGSFEEYSDCPISNELHNGQFERAIGWFRPTAGTPDYFHRCNTSTVNVPNNFWGHQEAFHGDGYVGFGAYEWHCETYELYGAEYIATKLVEQLKPCYLYSFQMRVNLANYSTYSHTKIGVYVSSELISVNTSDLLSREAQIVNEVPLTDTSNWVLISGEFQAKGNEQYLYIGYFEDMFVSDTMYVGNPFGIDWCLGYYYVDSVSLIEIGEVEGCMIEIPNVFTPNGDGINDFYSLDVFLHEKDFEFTILNRWGNEIITLNKDTPQWDGNTQGGNPCSPGVYFYAYSLEKWDGTLLTGNGTIHLVR